MRAVASCAHCLQPRALCCLPLRPFSSATGAPGKLPPDLEKMLNAAGIKLPQGARVEIKYVRGADLTDLPPFLRDIGSKKRAPAEDTISEKQDAVSEKRALVEGVSSNQTSDIIELPPAQDSSSEPSESVDESLTAGRKLKQKRKISKNTKQGVFDLFASGGVKSFVLKGPMGTNNKSDENRADMGLQARDWYQKQLLGNSAENPIDLNYFDRTIEPDFVVATAPTVLGAPNISLDVPWSADNPLPSEVRVDLSDTGKLTRILLPCKGHAFPSRDISNESEEKVHIEFCKGDLPLPETETEITIAFTPAVGCFFSPDGAIMKRTVIVDDQVDCRICGTNISQAKREAYTTGQGDELFLACSECIGHARSLREKGYAALAGAQIDSLEMEGAGKNALPSVGPSSCTMRNGRLLGATVKNMVPVDDDADEDESMPRLLTEMTPNRKFKVEKKVDARFADVLGQEIAVEKLQEFVDILRFPDSYDLVGSKVPKGGLLIGPPGTGKTLLAQAVAGECQLPFISVLGSEFNDSLVGSGPRNVRKLFKTARTHAAHSGGCIVFIDEVDSIGRSRSRTDNSSAGQGYCETLNQLLAEIDGFHSKTDQIVLLAATNRAKVLDKALLRAGRFDRVIPMERPNIKEREALFWHYLKRLAWRDGDDINWDGADLASATSDPHDSSELSVSDLCRALSKLNFPTPGSNVSFTDRFDKLIGTFVKPRFDISLARVPDATNTLTLKTKSRSILKIGSVYYVADDEHVSSVSHTTGQAIYKIAKTAARMTTGFTGATISSICNEAGIMAVRERIRAGGNENRLMVASVTSRHIAKAIDFVAAGSEKKNFRMRPEEKSSVAYHESGHTVVACLLEHHPDPVKVTIVPRDSGTLGFMMPGEPQSEVQQSRAQLEAQICVLMGGRISEKLFCDDVAAGAKSDIEQVTELARLYVSAYGMGEGSTFVNTSDERWLSEASKARRDESIYALIDDCYERTTSLLLEHRRKVEVLQEALLQKETIFADEIKAMLQ